VRDPLEMLHAVATRMEIMKSVRAAELVAIAASCLGATPAPMQELFWRGIPLMPLPLPLLNIICTNVAGPRSPLYTVGRRLVASYPHVPTGYELGLGLAVQSYDGKLFFGLTADAHVAPDVARLRDYIRVSFEELSKAARIKSGPPRVARPRPAKRTKPTKPEGRKKIAHGVSRVEPVVSPSSPGTGRKILSLDSKGETPGTDAFVCQPDDLGDFSPPSNGVASGPGTDPRRDLSHDLSHNLSHARALEPSGEKTARFAVLAPAGDVGSHKVLAFPTLL